jgi:ribosomal protein L40E
MGGLTLLVLVFLAFVGFVIYFIFKQMEFVLTATNLYKKMISREDMIIKLLLDIRDDTKQFDRSNEPEAVHSDTDEPNSACLAGGWYYHVGRDNHGPVSVNELRELYQKGKIEDDTVVWTNMESSSFLKNSSVFARLQVTEIESEQQDDEPEKYTCVKCGAEVSAQAETCPRCGKNLILDESNSCVCEKCGADVPDGERCCPKCGSEIDFVCSDCGTAISAHTTKCPTCGRLLTAIKDAYDKTLFEGDPNIAAYCPKCKATYRKGFAVCSDCGVNLILRESREKRAN